MSCSRCDDVNASSSKPEYFYRWKTANISMSGCREHIREVMKALTETQKAEICDTRPGT